ncbi:MAG: hypothetical protein ACFFCS_13730 [Candidatus Hodarchaeota archaeon]
MLHLERGDPNLLQLLKDNGYFVCWVGNNDLVPAQNGYENHCDVIYRPTKEDLARWGHTMRRSPHVSRKWRGKRGSGTGAMAIGYPAVKYHRCPPRAPLKVKGFT